MMEMTVSVVKMTLEQFVCGFNSQIRIDMQLVADLTSPVMEFKASGGLDNGSFMV